MATQLTPHFSLEELTTNGTHPEIKNELPLCYHDAILKLAKKLEEARAILDGAQIRVTYGYRGHELNKACGGSSTSAHCEAAAADIAPAGWQFRAAWEALIADKYFMVGIDQLILERGCIHVGLPLARRQYMPRHEIRTDANHDGVRVYPLYGIWTPSGVQK
jgi:hypothetical protein